jgi:hypothetical protein
MPDARAGTIMMTREYGDVRCHLAWSGAEVKEVIGLAINVMEFHAALLAVAADRSGKIVSNERLGRWLRQVQGKIVNGLRLLSYGMQRGYPLWKMTKE